MADKKGNSNVSSELFPKTVIEQYSPGNKDTPPKNILQFENLISGLSTALIYTPEEKLENELNNWVKRFVDFLKVDRCIVNEYLEDPRTMHILINYTVPEVDAVPVVYDYQPSEGVIKELEKGLIIRAEKIPDDLPQIFRGGLIEKDNTKSLIAVPLLTGNKVFGNLTFASYRKERKWPDELVMRIKLIGEIIANAILRIRSHKTLLEEMERRKILEEKYSSILKNASVGLWISNFPDSSIIDVNDEYCRMTGYSRDELISKKIWEIDASLDTEKVKQDGNIIDKDGSSHFETTHIKKDGSLLDVSISTNIFKQDGIICSFIRDVTELNQAKKEQAERLKFEELVSDFSAALININSDELIEELKKWIIKFVDFLEIGRGVINEYQFDKNTIKVLISYTDPAVTANTSPHDMDLKAPDMVMNEFKKGTTIRAEKIPEDLPAPFHGWIIEKHNTKSLVVVPLVARNQVIGNLTFASYRKERKWSDDIVRRIKLIGEIIANAILRLRAHIALIEEMEHRKSLEERYTIIIKNANVGFMITKDQDILVVNDEYCRMTGYSRKELLQMGISDIDLSGNSGKIEKEGIEVIQKGAFHHETKHIRKDGKIIDVEISSNYLEMEGVYFSFLRDITELNEAKRELEERLDFEELVSEFSAALINVKLYDITNEINQWLEHFAKLMNVDRCTIIEFQDDFTTLNFLFAYTNPAVENKVSPLPSRSKVKYGYHEYLKRGESVKFENADDEFPEDIKQGMIDMIKDGTKSLLTLPLITGEILLGSMAISTVTSEKKWTEDLTRKFKLVAEIFANALMREKTDVELDNYRKHLEEMVEERTDRLEKAQKELVIIEKMATLGKLTATVSHELRNPLGTIRASVFSLQKRLKDQDEKVVNSLNRAERNIRRCDLIIEELLNYFRTPKLNLEPTPIDSWINEVLGDTSPPEGISIEKKFEAGITIDMDQERFRRSMVNILTNAYQAIQEKVTDEPGCVSVRTYKDNNILIIDISDNGVGFDMNNKDKLFEPLYSTKTFGIGLGIPITLQIIAQHGWNIEIIGNPQVGTSVIITIPVVTK